MSEVTEIDYEVCLFLMVWNQNQISQIFKEEKQYRRTIRYAASSHKKVIFLQGGKV